MLTCQINCSRRPREGHLTAPRPAVSPPLTPPQPCPSPLSHPSPWGAGAEGPRWWLFGSPLPQEGTASTRMASPPTSKSQFLGLDWAGWRKCPQKLPLLCVDPAHCQQLQMAAGSQRLCKEAHGSHSPTQAISPISRAQPFRTFVSLAFCVWPSPPEAQEAGCWGVSPPHTSSYIPFLTLLFSSLFYFRPFFPTSQGFTFPKTLPHAASLHPISASIRNPIPPPHIAKTYQRCA